MKKMTEEVILKVAKECIEGKWGSGIVRKRNIEKAGYEYEPIRKKIAELRAEEKAKKSSKKKNDKKENKQVENDSTKDTKKSSPRKLEDSKNSHFKVSDEKKKELEEKEEKLLSPAEYFETIKGKIEEETSENVKRLFSVTMNQLKRFMITGQKTAAKELYSRCIYLEKEMQLLEKGITKYVLRNEIDNYIDNVADECVCVIEMCNFDRDIPDEIIDKVAETMDIFDQFFVVFTDYTGEKRSKVEAERRDKDPILFGNIFINGMVSPKMYFLGDWVDEYCDLTLDKMVSAIAKKESIEKADIVHDINDPKALDELEEELFGSSKRVSARTVAGKGDK